MIVMKMGMVLMIMKTIAVLLIIMLVTGKNQC